MESKNLIFNIHDLEQGDLIEFKCPQFNNFIQGKIVSFIQLPTRTIIECQQKNLSETIKFDFHQAVVVKLKSFEDFITNQNCTCGAKFTSNPNFHLNYCDLNV